jgi:uncharacterized protein YdeI (YjbR/CyaY-like superfamily)
MAPKSAEEYIATHAAWEKQLVQLRAMLLETELAETIKWGSPVYTINGKNVVAIAAFKNHCCLWFYNGALLKQNTSLLENAQEGKTKGLRQIRFLKEQEIPVQELKAYVQEAIENQKAGREIKPVGAAKAVTPPELDKAFAEDPELEKKFQALTPGRQREYCEYIDQAKREATKLSRIQKITPMIKDLIGLHDKYRNC